MTREEEYVAGLRVATEIWSKIREKAVDVEEALTLRLMVDFPGGLELHIGVRAPSPSECAHIMQPPGFPVPQSNH